MDDVTVEFENGGSATVKVPDGASFVEVTVRVPLSDRATTVTLTIPPAAADDDQSPM